MLISHLRVQYQVFKLLFLFGTAGIKALPYFFRQMSLPVALGLVPRPRANSGVKKPTIDHKLGTQKQNTIDDKLVPEQLIDKKERSLKMTDKNLKPQQTIDKKPEQTNMTKNSEPQQIIENKYGLTLSKMEMYYVQDNRKRQSKRK